MWDGFGDGVQRHTHTHTHIRERRMPDGYVKMLFEMMSPFFIPTEFIQDRAGCFFHTSEKENSL